MCIPSFLIDLEISLGMVFDGFIMFWFEFRDCVYGCGVEVCFLGGFCDVAIFCRGVVVHSGVGVCTSFCEWWYLCLFCGCIILLVFFFGGFDFVMRDILVSVLLILRYIMCLCCFLLLPLYFCCVIVLFLLCLFIGVL